MLGSYTLYLILSGLAYLILVYLMVTFMKKRKGDAGSADDDDGGISVKGPPVIDLPPGVCLPDGSPRLILKEEEEREEIIF